MTHTSQTVLALLGLAFVAALSIPLGLWYLTQSVRTVKETARIFTRTNWEYVALGTTFLVCGAVLAYMLLLAVGIAPETHAQHLTHWHASASVGLLAVAFPRETPEQYLARVDADYADSKLYADSDVLAFPFGLVSDAAFAAFYPGYMDRATFDVSHRIGYELFQFGLVDADGSVSEYGRHAAAYGIMRARLRVLLAALL